MKIFNLIICVASVSLLTGCSMIYQQPGTELLAPHEKAIIHAKFLSGNVALWKIDGVERKGGGFLIPMKLCPVRVRYLQYIMAMGIPQVSTR